MPREFHQEQRHTTLIVERSITPVSLEVSELIRKTYMIFTGAVIAGLIPLFFLVSTQDSANFASDTSNTSDDYYQRGAASDATAGKQIGDDGKRYLCGATFAKSNQYIEEYDIPYPCAQPVGLVAGGDGRIWTISTWTGHIMIFDPSSNSFTDFIEIPNWKTKGTFGSMVWSMEFDSNGDLWFTDQVNNAVWRYFVQEDRFEMYKVPTKGSYPLNIAFDSAGEAWFTEIFGKKLGHIDPGQVRNNSTAGITEYEIPDLDFETMGPLTVDKSGEILWLTAVSYPDGGNVVRFDIQSKEFAVYDLPEEAGVPVGIKEDEQGKLWINDHATNLFFMLDPETGSIKKYSTSLPTSRPDTTTLPYWNQIRDGKVWFNEHEGNAIAYFDIANSTLVEYQIPTRAETWGNTTNPLQFDIDGQGSVWFTEWSENKIGMLRSDAVEDLPFELSLSKDALEIDLEAQKGDSLEISILPLADNVQDLRVEMTAAGSVSPSGRLSDLKAEFSEESLTLDETRHTVSLSIEPLPDKLEPGDYTLTIGARYGSVTVNKIVDLKIK